MPFGRRDAADKCLEFLDIVEKKNGKASKWDFIKIAGSEAAFRRWVTNFLLKHRLVEELKEGRKTLFKKTERGELLHRTLRYDSHLVIAFKRISGERLKSET